MTTSAWETETSGWLQVEEAMLKYDADGSGALNIEEFLDMWHCSLPLAWT